MTEADGTEEPGGELEGISPRVAAAAIRDAIEALEHERPDLAERLQTLLGRLDDPDG